MNRPRERQSGKGLLPNIEAVPWASARGKFTFYWRDSLRRRHNLGTDRLLAIRKTAELMGVFSNEGTVSYLWEQYTRSQEWAELKETTHADYRKSWKELSKCFAAMYARDIRPPDIHRYLRVERGGKTRANREVAVLSNILQEGINSGALESNPCANVRRNRETPKRPLPSTADLGAFVAWLDGSGGSRRVLSLMAQFAAHAGNRRAEFLGVTLPQLSGSEARLKRAKQRGKREQIERVEIVGELVAIVEQMRALPRPAGSLHVWINEDKKPFTEGGFNSLWHRAMKEALAKGVVSERFTFHSLRAWFTDQYRNQHGKLPNIHKNPATTANIYSQREGIKRQSI